MDAALQISGRQMMISNDNMAGEMNHTDYLSDCKGVVYSYLSKQLSSEVANEAFRMLSACKVNKVRPLAFKEPSEVIAVCKNIFAPSPTCCSSLNAYIAETQQKILITNKQAIICATQFGSMLRGGGGMTNVYELCDVDLKDFGIQAFGVQDAGCLLRSLPGDVIFDNASDVSFTCDLSDNIATLHPDPTSETITGGSSASTMRSQRGRYSNLFVPLTATRTSVDTTPIQPVRCSSRFMGSPVHAQAPIPVKGSSNSLQKTGWQHHHMT